MNYTDETIMLTGRYKFTKLKNIPSEYLIKLYENSSINDRDLINYINLNMDKLKGVNTKTIINKPLCDKYAYATKKIAKESLKIIENKVQKYKKPVRVYECEKCGFWHLTSIPLESYNKPLEENISYRKLALNECKLNGIVITGKQFDIVVKEYNDFKMPLSERHKLIAEKDPKFIEYLKQFKISYV